MGRKIGRLIFKPFWYYWNWPYALSYNQDGLLALGLGVELFIVPFSIFIAFAVFNLSPPILSVVGFITWPIRMIRSCFPTPRQGSKFPSSSSQKSQKPTDPWIKAPKAEKEDKEDKLPKIWEKVSLKEKGEDRNEKED